MNEMPLPRDHNRPPITEALADAYRSLKTEVEQIAERANKTPRKIATEDDLDAVGTLVKDVGALIRKVDDRRKTEKQPFLDGGREVDGFFATMTDRLDRIRQTFQKAADDHAREKAAAERRAREEEARRLREEEEQKRRDAEAAKRASTQERKIDEAERLAERAAEAEAAARASAADLTRMRTGSGTLATAATEWTFEITDYEAIPLDRLRPYFKREEVEKAIRSLVRTHKGASALPGVRVFEDVRARFR